MFEDNVDITRRRFEFTVLQMLAHPYLLPIKQHFAGRPTPSRRVTHICITEWVEQNTLQLELEIRKEEGRMMNEQEIMRIFVQVAMAIEQIHFQGLLHSNISSSHIYVGEVVLVGSYLNQGVQRKTDCYQGEWYYLSPEMVKKGGKNKFYDTPSEIWALGMLLLEMLLHFKPNCQDEFYHLKNQSQTNMTEAELSAGKHHQIASGFSPFIHSILDIMLQADPKKRGSIYDILLSPHLINQLNQMETCPNFKQLMGDAFLRRIDLGWCRDKDIKQFQPEWPKSTKYGKKPPGNIVTDYFKRIRQAGSNYRLKQFKLGNSDGNDSIQYEYHQVEESFRQLHENNLLTRGSNFDVQSRQLSEDIEIDEEIDFDNCIKWIDKLLEKGNKKNKKITPTKKSFSLNFVSLLESKLRKDPQNTHEVIRLAQSVIDESGCSFDKIENILMQSLEISTQTVPCYFLLAKLYFAHQKFKASIDCFAMVLGLSSQTNNYHEKNEAQFLVACAEKRLNQAGQSIGNFAKCLHFDTDHFKASIHLANLLLEHDFHEPAVSFYQNAIRIHPQSVSAHFGMMLAIKSNLKEKDSVVQFFKETLVVKPNNVEVLTQLAILRLFDYQDLKSLHLLHQALSTSNSYPPALSTMGELLRFNGRPAEAKKYFQRVLQINSDQISALKGLAKACYENGEEEEAFRCVEQIMGMKNDWRCLESDLVSEGEMLFPFAVNEAKLGRRDKAVDIFTELMQFDKNDEGAKQELSKIGVWYRQSAQLEKAYQIFMEILQIDRKFLKAKEELLKLGLVYLDQLQHEKACEIFLDIFLHDCEYPPVLTQLTKLINKYQNSGKNDLGKEILHQMLTIDKDYAKIKLDLAQVGIIGHFWTGQIILAVDILLDSIESTQNYAVSLDELGKVVACFKESMGSTVAIGEVLREVKEEKVLDYMVKMCYLFCEAGKIDRGCHLLIEVLHKDKFHAKAIHELHKLGVQYKMQGQRHRCDQLFRQALSISPSYAWAKQELLTLAMAYRIGGQLAPARDALFFVFKIDQQYEQVEKELIRIAIIHQEREELQEAFAIFRDISVIGKQTQENDLLTFDMLFQKSGSYKITQFIDDFKKDTSNPQAKQNLIKMAIMFRGTGENESAEKILLEILKVDPNHKESKDELIILSVMYQMTDEFEKSLQILIKVLEIDAGYVQVKEEMVNLGAAYLGIGQIDKAIDVFMVVLDHDSEFTKAEQKLAELGAFLKKSDQQEKAIYMLQNVLRIDSNYPLIRKELLKFTLHQRLKDNSSQNIKIEEKKIIEWIQQLCNQLLTLDSVHGQISTQSLFLLQDDKIKLESGSWVDSQFTEQFRAPDFDQIQASDIWSLGQVILTICTRSLANQQDLHSGKIPPIPFTYSLQLQCLITEMLHVTSTRRPNIDKILVKNIIRTSKDDKESLFEDDYEQVGKPLEQYDLEYKKIGHLGKNEHVVVQLVQRLGDGKIFIAKRQVKPDYASYIRARHELNLLKKVKDHPNFLCLEDKFHTQGQLDTIIVVEYCQNGTLFDFLKGQAVSEEFMINVLRETLTGLQYAHSKNVWHQDLKPANLYMMPYGSIKIGGFGVRKSEDTTSPYQAPETLKKDHSAASAADIWSLGCILHEMATGKSPTFQAKPTEIKEKILNHFPIRISAQKYTRQFRYILYEMLNKEPENRPSVSKLLESNLLTNIQGVSKSVKPLQIDLSIFEADGKGQTSEELEEHLEQGLLNSSFHTKEQPEEQKSRDFTVRSHRMTQMSDYVPSKEELGALSSAQLGNHFLTHIQHDDQMKMVSFLFTHGFTSPSPHIYKSTPTWQVPVPQSLSSLHFKVKNTYPVSLYAIELFSCHTKTAEINPTDTYTRHLTGVLDLELGVRVVSARVYVWCETLCKVTFLLYDCI